MGSSIDLLLSDFAGPAQAGEAPTVGPVGGVEPPRELAELLLRRNGFFAFHSALLVLPWGRSGRGLELAAWNAPDLWRCEYQRADFRDLIFFAMDAFGDQFWLSSTGAGRLESETGALRRMGDGLEAWAAAILADPNYETAWPLCHEWQKIHGALPDEKRLAPAIPFAFEGEYAVSNLHAVDAVEAMRFRGDMATQMADVPPGTKVRIELVD